MKKIKKVLLLIGVAIFLHLASCEEDKAFFQKKPTITLLSPVNKANGVDIAPEFEWEASDPDQKALEYDFYVGLDSTKLFLQAKNLIDKKYQLTDYKLRKEVTYYWRVVAKNGDQEKESDIWSFRSIPAPETPILLGPTNTSFVRDALTFEWKPVPAGKDELISYKLFLGKTNPPTDVLSLIKDGSVKYTLDPSTLQLGETYYWKVEATDLINSTSSEVRSFKRLASGAPDEPMIISPINQQGIKSGTILDWSSVLDPENDVVTYDLYMDKVNPPIAKIANLTASEFTTTILDANSAYYWYVVAKDPSGHSTKSVTSSFAAIGNGPGFPAIHDFKVGGVYSLDETLIWDASQGATSYDVYLDTANPPVNKIATNITETQFKFSNKDIPSDLTDVKTYYALVVAKDGSGSTTNSFPVSFKPQMTGVYTDTRAQEVLNYNWVRVGKQIWMSQNLRTKKLTNGEDLKLMGPIAIPLNANSTDLYYDEHPENITYNMREFPTPWSNGDNGRVYSSLVYQHPLIAPSGWHVITKADTDVVQNYAKNPIDLLGVWYGGTNPYGLNLVPAGYRYDSLDPNSRPQGFAYNVEYARPTFWFLGGANNAWEVNPTPAPKGSFRSFAQGNPHTRMFGIRLIKND